MAVDEEKELRDFIANCGDRFKPQFAKGMTNNPNMRRFRDASLNRRFYGWLACANWKDYERRQEGKPKLETPEQEGARLFARGVPAAKVYASVSDRNMADLDTVMAGYSAAAAAAQGGEP
jgi:hypothetical protein